MKFQILDILPNLKNPVTGRKIRPDQRYSPAQALARYTEEFGFDAVALGDWHAGPFLSSGVTVTLVPWVFHRARAARPVRAPSRAQRPGRVSEGRRDAGPAGSP